MYFFCVRFYRETCILWLPSFFEDLWYLKSFSGTYLFFNKNHRFDSQEHSENRILEERRNKKWLTRWSTWSQCSFSDELNCGYSEVFPKKPKEKLIRVCIASTVSSSYCKEIHIGKGHLKFPHTNGSVGLWISLHLLPRNI